MVILFDRFNLPEDIYEVIFATKQQIIVAKLLIEMIKENNGEINKTEMSFFATKLHEGNFVTTLIDEAPYKGKKVNVYLEQRRVNEADNSKILEVYKCEWEDGTSIRLPLQRTVDSRIGGLLATNPDLYDLFGIYLAFSDQQPERLNNLTNLLNAANLVDQAKMRPRRKEIIGRALKFYTDMERLDMLIEPYKKDPKPEKSSLELPKEITDIKGGDTAWLNAYVNSKENQEIKELLKDLAAGDSHHEVLGRKIGAAIYKSRYFDPQSKISEDAKTSLTVDPSIAEPIIDPIIKEVVKDLEQEIEKFKNKDNGSVDKKVGRLQNNRRELEDKIRDHQEQIDRVIGSPWWGFGREKGYRRVLLGYIKYHKDEAERAKEELDKVDTEISEQLYLGT